VRDHRDIAHVTFGGRVVGVSEKKEKKLTPKSSTEEPDAGPLHCPEFRCVIHIPHLRF
jgi:hypothetical protein